MVLRPGITNPFTSEEVRQGNQLDIEIPIQLPAIRQSNRLHARDREGTVAPRAEALLHGQRNGRALTPNMTSGFAAAVAKARNAAFGGEQAATPYQSPRNFSDWRCATSRFGLWRQRACTRWPIRNS